MTVTRHPLAVELRALLTIAVPLAAANLAQMLMGLVSMVMVGHVGGIALAGAGLGAGLYFTLVIICRSVLVAVAPLAAHAIGRGDRAEAGHIAGTGLLMAALAALPIVAALHALAPLLALIGYAPELAAEVGRYLGTVCWGAPAFLGFEVLRALLAATARARAVMVAVVLALPAHAVLSWALVFGHLGAPPLAVVGAGAATATIQWLLALGLGALILLAPRGAALRLPRRIASPVVAILRLGLPIGGLIALEVGVFAAAGILMGLFGADALAAHQLALNLSSLAFMIPLGVGQAATVRVAHALGAASPQAARGAGIVALLLGAAIMSVSGAVIWAMPRPIAGLYVDLADPANRGTVAIAVELLLVAALFQVFDGVQVIAAGALRGYRDTTVPMAIAAFGYWGIGFAGGWLLAFPLGRGPLGLWLGLAGGLAVVATLLTIRLLIRGRVAARTGARPLP
ncbi:MAG TPA: MATE family efflux transporter, partial [Stellaceae bacterium]|nr:MATE family efflux transporter [Stellaceae bacterium]